MPCPCRKANQDCNMPSPSPERYPITAPYVQVIGHACQGRSQSSGIGNAPIQAPTTQPTVGQEITYLMLAALTSNG